MNTYKAPIAIHPGETLKEILSTGQMTQVQLANRTGLHHVTISNIISGKDPISPETALCLSLVFGMSEGFWNNLQKNYDETKARIALEQEIVKELSIYNKFTCIPELIKYKFLEDTKLLEDKAKNLLNFLGIASFKLLKKNYSVAFRKSSGNELSNENLIAWLRCGEIVGTAIETKPFNKAKLKANINTIRELNLLKAEHYSEKLRDLLAECGVAIAFLPYFKKTYVNGATRWLNPQKVLIQLTPRNKYEDIFWFTLFHEICHVLKHKKKEGYICFWDKNHLTSEVVEIEREADSFGADVLIPPKEWNQFIASGHINNNRILNFSKKIGVKPGIVAGRYANETGRWAKISKLRTQIRIS